MKIQIFIGDNEWVDLMVGERDGDIADLVSMAGCHHNVTYRFSFGCHFISDQFETKDLGIMTP